MQALGSVSSFSSSTRRTRSLQVYRWTPVKSSLGYFRNIPDQGIVARYTADCATIGCPRYPRRAVWTGLIHTRLPHSILWGNKPGPCGTFFSEFFCSSGSRCNCRICRERPPWRSGTSENGLFPGSRKTTEGAAYRDALVVNSVGYLFTTPNRCKTPAKQGRL